jgi:multicomponent Na+:H+ antiporter subunit E
VIHAISLTIMLAAFWLLNSGHYTALLLSLGGLSVLLVVGIALRMDVVDHEAQPVHITPSFIGYWLWLAREIVKANIDVVRRIWHPRLPLSPVLVRVPSSQKTVLGKVIFANSITLTPGTVSVVVAETDILVHALSREGADDLLAGEMDRRVTRIEE